MSAVVVRPIAGAPEDAARRPLLVPRLAGAALLVLGLPFALALWFAVAFAHELLVLLFAALLPVLTSPQPIQDALQALPVNYVYAAAMVRYAGQIEPGGLAMAGDVGEYASRLWPTIFFDPSFVAGHGLASAVLGAGSSLLARTLASGLANASLLGLGLWLVARARRGLALRSLGDLPAGRAWLLLVGVVVQAEVAARVLRAPGSSRDLETLGVLPFISHELLGMSGDAYSRLLYRLSLYLDPYFPEALLFGLYAGLGLVALVASRARDWRLEMPAPRRPLVVEGALVAVLVAALPWADLVGAESRFLELELAPGGGTVEVVEAPTVSAAPQTGSTIAPDALAPPAEPALPATTLVPPEVGAGARRAPIAPPAVPGAKRPSVVSIGGRGLDYVYVVNGVPTELKGMGYNVTHAGLPPPERARRLALDFELMRDVGVNTVLGWRGAEWDEQVLDAADAYGIGVVLPYDLDDSLDYSDRAVRFRVKSDVLAWVARYKDHPAIRMWGIGNESLLHLKQTARARAFADFYAGLVDAVREMDPDHPILYREAEDVYVRWLAEAFAAHGGAPSGLVLGMNFYTMRLRDAIADWPKKGLDVPVVISEFAPAGVGRGERPAGYARMWAIIRGRPEFVLGAAPYVWNVEGPEPVDRLFGLSDGAGHAVDGTLAALKDLYTAPRPGLSPLRAPPLLGVPEADARRLIESLGLKLGDVVYQSPADLRDPTPYARYGVGRVISQEPAAGAPLEPGGVVRIAVAVPPPQLAPVGASAAD